MGMNLRTDTYKIKMYLISNDNKINNSQRQNLSKKKKSLKQINQPLELTVFGLRKSLR